MADQFGSYDQGFFANAQSYVSGTITAHPMAAALSIAALIVLSVVLMYYVYKGSASKSTFITPNNNHTMGGNNPLWHLGADDAGWGGPVHRESTAYHAAAFDPALRSLHPRHRPTPEHFTSPCGVGEVAVQTVDGQTYCRPASAALVNGSHCPTMSDHTSSTWDPTAIMEAQALAVTGSFQHDAIGERKLQHAINQAHDADVDAAYYRGGSYTDDQLNQMMHLGGTH